MIRKFFPFIVIFFVTIIFFWQFFIKGFLPVPSDTIIGLYHPYRDLYSKEYPNGIPFKNFLITDPVRQTIPWKMISVDSIRELEIPNWNPYSFTGTPLLANFQSSPLYFFNVIFLIFSFNLSWSLFIIIQPFLASFFLYLYLRNLKIDKYASLIGSTAFAFSGFFTTWLEWGNILHTGLWLPLILLSIDRISAAKNIREKTMWSIIIVFSSVNSFFGGHLQTFFYLSLLSSVYLILRVFQSKEKEKLGILFLVTWLITFLITSIQLIPTLKFILLSARSLDQITWQKEGWFLPWQNLVQFLVPDFFGNPTTLNYWGIWNYGELTAYIGILPLIVALFAIIFRRDRKTYFFTGVFMISLLLALPNLISKIPFVLDIPLISSSQPTRLIYLVDFSLAVLAALGLDYLIKKGKIKQVLIPVVVIAICLFSIYIFIKIGASFGFKPENLFVSGRNIILPSGTFLISGFLLILLLKIKKQLRKFILIGILVLTVADLFRFSWKFNTFSNPEYLFPKTKTLEFISENIGSYRIATTDARILPPNFSSAYKIQTVEGYDPLFLNRYAEFISAINRNEPNIEPPYGFNRIVRVESFSGNLINLLGIKYILSLNEFNERGFVKVFEEGQTKVYENKNVLPKAFFVSNVINSENKEETIRLMFDSTFDPSETAIVEGELSSNDKLSKGTVNILNYSENKIVIETNIDQKETGFLVLNDSYYPGWHVRMEGYDSEGTIIRTDYNFRGIFVPGGKQIITFYKSIL